MKPPAPALKSKTNQQDNIIPQGNFSRYTSLFMNSKHLPTGSLRKVVFDELLFDGNLLGRGAQGEVWSGHHNHDLVAIKKIRVRDENVGSVQREIDVLKRLGHPNIVQTMGYCYHQQNMYIVMELIQGYSLHSIIFDRSIPNEYNLNQADTDKVIIQLSQAVAYLHHGDVMVFHGDIKRSNIMVQHSKDSTVAKLCDFGLSKLYEFSETVIGYSVVGKSRCGTYPYMSPEMINFINTNPTKASDVWAVGCTILETYNKKSLFSNECEKVIQEQKKEFRTTENFRNIPNVIRNTVKNFFSFDADKRPEVGIICDFYNLHKKCWKSLEQIRQEVIDRSIE